jgi:hypothetical protein
MRIELELFDGTPVVKQITEIKRFVRVGYDYIATNENENPTVEPYLYEDPYVILVLDDGTEKSYHRDDIITKIEKDKRR